MFSLSPMKLFIIVAVVDMLLGPDKLPDVAHRLGTWWHSLRRFQQRVENEVRATLPDLPSTSDIARIARNPVSVLNDFIRGALTLRRLGLARLVEDHVQHDRVRLCHESSNRP